MNMELLEKMKQKLNEIAETQGHIEELKQEYANKPIIEAFDIAAPVIEEFQTALCFMEQIPSERSMISPVEISYKDMIITLNTQKAFTELNVKCEDFAFRITKEDWIGYSENGRVDLRVANELTHNHCTDIKRRIINDAEIHALAEDEFMESMLKSLNLIGTFDVDSVLQSFVAVLDTQEKNVKNELTAVKESLEL